MNEQNLKRFDQYDPEELREISVKGGKASGQSRQERKRLREELTALLSSGDLQQRVCLALIDKAIAGDPRAFIALRDSLGEKLPDGLSLEVSGNTKDLQSWKDQHIDELQQLFLDEINREQPLYGDLVFSLMTYQERVRILSQEVDAAAVQP